MYPLKAEDRKSRTGAEFGGHACPRIVRLVSVSANFEKFYVRVRVRVRHFKLFHAHVRGA